MDDFKLLFFLLLATISSSRSSPIFFDQDGVASRTNADYRLPTNSKPIHYVIKLNPHLTNDNFTFTGEVTITLEVVQASTNITLHSKEQTIDESRTFLAPYNDNTTRYSITHNYDTTTDFLILSANETLPVGNYTLIIHYTGDLRDDMIGFYRSSYTNSNNETVWIATSKFEPTHARYAFPCYDEPALKATVDIWLKREQSQHALANTNIYTEKKDNSDNKTWSIFETTPLISTYLIAFIASDFGSIRNADNTFGVWARSDVISTAQYSFDFGIKSLERLENHTSVKYYGYSLPKMDQIAIPDFASGAMENWGLVTYRERYLLYQDGVSTKSDRQGIATVIAHEFGHQWYGNLVGPEWWTYLWLNEGFATYFEYFNAHEIESTWRLDQQFPVVELQAKAFAVDGLGTSHAMNANVKSPTEIRSIFDSISYAKAGSVIRMMEHVIGTPVFKTGLNNYLVANQFNTGTSDLLWKGIQTAVDQTNLNLNIKRIMDTWVTQPGFPVITVTRNYDAKTALVQQERFYLADAATYNSTSYYWWVPINYVVASDIDFTDTAPETWIPATDNISISSLSSNDWIILNRQQTGYYRVNYDKTNWKLITTYLNSESYNNIHVVNRAQLLDDAFNLARAGYIDYTIALDLTTYLAQETDYIPWYSAFTGLNYLYRWLGSSDSYDLFKAYVLKLIAKSQETLTLTELSDDEHVETLHRTNVLSWACKLNQSKCLSTAAEKFSAWLLDGYGTAITPNLKTVFFCYGIQQSNSTVWNELWKKYLATDLSSEQRRILSALGCTEDVDILNQYMSLATTTGSGIRAQDSTTAFSAVYTASPKNVEVALDYIINNLDSIYEYYGGTGSIATLLSGIGLRITNNELLEKLVKFSEQQSSILGGAASTGIANARRNLAWIEKYEPVVAQWLSEELPENEGSGAASTIGSITLPIVFIFVMRYFQ
ncbi:aminopeptidase N [Cephus cinctus]|uniref:Aminopeptidase n=1 Tax=Cephus cinctus TaxID=211228 RepID=A0AAJ7C8Y0_CEPCN|nr:aminopeptidase N [Cephus cinctus]